MTTRARALLLALIAAYAGVIYTWDAWTTTPVSAKPKHGISRAHRGDLCLNLRGVQWTVPQRYWRDGLGFCWQATEEPTPTSDPAPTTPSPTATPSPTPTTAPTTTSTPSSTPTAEPTTPTPTPTATPTPTTTTEPEPTTVPGPPAGTTRILFDDFAGTAVDTTKWSVYTGHLTSSDGCNEPDNLQVADGILTMLFAYQADGVCGAGWYHGSMMVKSLYGGNNQAVTVRFRVVSNDPANTRAHRIIPMRWPNQDPWYVGESDYCEGSSLSSCTTYLHHTSSSDQVASPSHTFDQTQWHTFRAVQLPGNDVQIFIDDMTTPRWVYDGTTTTVPDVVKRTVLQQECRSSCPTNLAGTERIEVDWLTIDNAS